jgi:hypothetical protein
MYSRKVWSETTPITPGEMNRMEDAMEAAYASLDYNMTGSDFDLDGNPKTVEYKRRGDNTLYLRSVASNPDANGFYQTYAVTIYKEDGVTVAQSKTLSVAFNSAGKVTSRSWS